MDEAVADAAGSPDRKGYGLSVPSNPPIDLTATDAPAGALHGARAVTMRTVRQTQAQLRQRPPHDPSVHDVAAALGCPPGAVLGVLAATSGARFEDRHGVPAGSVD